MTEEKSIIKVRTGWTFSKSIESSDKGEYQVIQLRDVQDLSLAGLDWANITRTNIDSTRTIKTLQDNEVLLVAKGHTKTALLLKNLPDNVVANQHFLIVTVNDTSKLLPEYLEVFLNSTSVQNWFTVNSSGSYQSTLTKKRLLELKLPTELPIEHQQMLVDLDTSIKKEKYLQQLLIKQREQEMDKFSEAIWSSLK
ncbi:restriction endonuclease subunit S [Alteromonas sp. ASW11-130]|uniref:restriction endonuclease subunit S n=1 Tax=Alteromonas sp. ASW11-130 TaxID=3015775 RepID=UPI002241D9E2|nr:restriction endonuclease subunit S [Alteromonas sp. ASW11-130]MCW8091558.1 restriction endonuclease subunit S [Alteromonas sp. ASW11-130]